jgi:RNA polymerase primary sigma factor
MTSVPRSDDRREELFLADFHPRLGAWLARQYASGYDAEAGRAQFLTWLAAHAETGEALVDYLGRVAAVPRLTAEEEAVLATRISAGRRAEERLVGEPAGEARAGLEQVAQDGLLAGTRLLEANLWLVVSLAERCADRGVPFSDLVQEGNRGLIRAVQRYDHAKGYRFATFATWWIRQAITQAVTGRTRATTSRTLAVMAARREEAAREVVERLKAERLAAAPGGVRQSMDIDELTLTEHRMLQALGREPTPEEIAAELDLLQP